MEVIKAVIKDLYLFAHGAFFAGWRYLLPGRTKTLALPLPLESATLLPAKAGRSDQATLNFVKKPHTPLFIQPTLAFFDNVKIFLPYGAEVLVTGRQGRLVEITYKEQTGWVFYDDLCSRADDIFPRFSTSQIYSHDHPDTLKVRLFIDDMFAGGLADLPLHEAEYVVYKLSLHGHRLVFDKTRPRLPGDWHKLLRSVEGTRLSIKPTASSVIEYFDDGDGRLAFVEAVFPDERILLSGLSPWPENRYFEDVFDKEEWREWRPVFITVT